MVPDDNVTRRCPAGLAHSLGPTTLTVIGAAETGAPAASLPLTIPGTASIPSSSPSSSDNGQLVIAANTAATPSDNRGPRLSHIPQPIVPVVTASYFHSLFNYSAG